VHYAHCVTGPPGALGRWAVPGSGPPDRRGPLAAGRWAFGPLGLRAAGAAGPLFTKIEKNNCFSIYTGSDLNNIFRKKALKIDLIDLSTHAFTPAILFLFGLRIIHSVGGE